MGNQPMIFNGSSTEASRLLTKCIQVVARRRGVSASTVRAESTLKAEAWELLRKRWTA